MGGNFDQQQTQLAQVQAQINMNEQSVGTSGQDTVEAALLQHV